MKAIKFKTLNNEIPRFVLKTAKVIRSKKGVVKNMGLQILSSTTDETNAALLPFSAKNDIERFYQTDEVTFLE